MAFKDDEDMAAKKRRAIYRACHRGTREMDYLLGRFALAKVEEMNQAELELLEEMMSFPDPILAGALVDRVGTFDREIEALLEGIRQFHKDKA